MRDLLDFQAAVPDFDAGLRYIHLVEASQSTLRSWQRTQLEQVAARRNKVLVFPNDATGHTNPTTTPTPSAGDNASAPVAVYWHDSFAAFEQWMKDHHSDTRDGPLATYAIGQEFIDALPVYSFEKTQQGYWRERLVSLPSEEPTDRVDGNDTGKKTLEPHRPKPRLVLVQAPEVTPPLRTLLPVDADGYLENDSDKVPAGSVLEVNPEGILFVQDMARFLERSAGGGAALLIDYGQKGSTDSIRAFSRHEQVGFLSQPGLVDITADVDFAALEHAVNHPRKDRKNENTEGTSERISVAYGPVTQGDFLMAMGLQERVLNAIEDDNTTDEQAEDLYQAMVRLASPEEMGERYKVLCIVTQEDGTATDPPPGF